MTHQLEIVIFLVLFLLIYLVICYSLPSCYVKCIISLIEYTAAVYVKF
jgi:hypothetical protein